MLAAVREQDAYTNLVLPPLLRSRGITGRDAAFVTELVSGTIRRRATYDAVLAFLVNRPLEQVDPPVLDLLRLGTHQLLAMRVPSHAAVGTTVDLVREKVGHGPAGFVNAVLRKVAARDLDAWVRRVAADPDRDPLGYAAVVHSHPRWVVEALAEALGDAGGLEELLAADNLPPKVTLAARPGLCTVEELVAAGGVASTRVAVRRGAARAATRASCPRSPRAGPACRTPGRRPSPSRWPPPPSTARTSRWLDLCAGPGRQVRAARRASPAAGVPGCSRPSCSRTAPGWWRPRPGRSGPGCSAW